MLLYLYILLLFPNKYRNVMLNLWNCYAVLTEFICTDENCQWELGKFFDLFKETKLNLGEQRTISRIGDKQKKRNEW